MSTTTPAPSITVTVDLMETERAAHEALRSGSRDDCWLAREQCDHAIAAIAWHFAWPGHSFSTPATDEDADLVVMHSRLIGVSSRLAERERGLEIAAMRRKGARR